MKLANLCYLPLFCVALLGCGTDRPETVPVSGRITMDEGDLPAPGRIHFAPLAAAPGFSMRPGSSGQPAAEIPTISPLPWAMVTGLSPIRF